jgi:hypothetical protein
METSLGSLGAAVVLALVYVGGAWLGEHGAAGVWTRRRWVSAAAGVSVAYVFVDVLPELAEHHRAFRAAMGEGLLFAEQRIYVLALVAFVVLYGLEHMVLAARAQRRHAVAAGVPDAVYGLHLGGFVAYSALIGYLLVERAERGPLALAIYGLAMALHFLIVDHSFREEHGRVYDRTGRWVLAASVLVGWMVGATTSLSPVVFARLFAVLAGGVVITSLRAELPGDREGRFWPFCLGAAAYAVLLFLT